MASLETMLQDHIWLDISQLSIAALLLTLVLCTTQMHFLQNRELGSGGYGGFQKWQQAHHRTVRKHAW